MQKHIWFVGVGTQEDNGTTFTHVKRIPSGLWKNPRRGAYIPRRVLKTYLDISPEEGRRYNPKIRLIHIFDETAGEKFNAMVSNALAYGGPGADLEVEELLENLVGCGILSMKPESFPAEMLGPSPLLE